MFGDFVKSLILCQLSLSLISYRTIVRAVKIRQKIPYTNSMKWLIPNGMGLPIYLCSMRYILSPLWSRRLNLITFARVSNSIVCIHIHIVLIGCDSILRTAKHSSVPFTKVGFYSIVIASMKSKIFFFFWCLSLILCFVAFVNIVQATRMIVRSYREWECASKVWKISLITLLLDTNHCRKKYYKNNAASRLLLENMKILILLVHH